MTDQAILAIAFFAALVWLFLLWLIIRSAVISALKYREQDREAESWLRDPKRE
jgi:hypothetical protein